MNELARLLALIAPDRLCRLERGKPIQAEATQNAILAQAAQLGRRDVQDDVPIPADGHRIACHIPPADLLRVQEASRGSQVAHQVG